jgi:hypothetical protein
MASLIGERQIHLDAPDEAALADRRTGGADRRRNLPDRRKGGSDRRRAGAACAGSPDAAARDEAVEISVVMPCLNEEESVGLCVEKAWEGIRRSGRSGEVIVSDNGSTDRSVEVALAAGARVVHQPERGYGNAYLAGFDAARGSIIVMGDSDDSYDFSVLADLVAPIIEQGQDYVLGSRLQGEIQRGAMPWTHRYIGNPVLTTFLNLLFKLRVSDAHSGFRVFTRDALQKMDLQCGGMELASEIVVKAAGANLSIAEVPITYHPRVGHSKLNSVRDACRHIRFLLLSSPVFLFLLPGILLVLAGLVQLALFGVSGGESTMVLKSLLAFALFVGVELLVLGAAATASTDQLLLGRARRISIWVSSGTAAKQAFVAGFVFTVVGAALLIYGSLAGWGTLGSAGPSASALVLSILLAALGVTLWFDAFFLSLFEATWRRSPRVTESPRAEAWAAGSRREDSIKEALSFQP